MEPKKITIKGACEHNLKNISVEIPKKKFVVFTGVSGSGKSSLAFDILYAEGQRRYVESLSSYARQFLGQMTKPHFEHIQGLSPAISIEQKAASKNPRSTVGTVTEIYDYLRVLYSNIGTQHCIKCKKAVSKQSPAEIASLIKKDFSGKIILYAELIENRKGEFKDIFESLKISGFNRVRVDGEIYDLNETNIILNKKIKHNVEVVIDRLNIRAVRHSRLSEAIENGLDHGSQRIVVEDADCKIRKIYSQKLACVKCGISYKELSPQSFSFNSPVGMCDHCNGLGFNIEVDPDLIVMDDSLSIKQGAVRVWKSSAVDGDGWYGSIVKSLLSSFKINTDIPWKKLSEREKNIIMYGAQEKKISVNYSSRKSSNRWHYQTSYQGIVNDLRRKFHESASERARDYYRQYMRDMNCENCKGARLKDEYLNVFISGLSIEDVSKLTISDAYKFFTDLRLKGNQKVIADEILKEIKSRLNFLLNVGLEYLTLNRHAPTLSGGESQRIRLASQIGSELSGVMYILDEPSIGLHQRDNERLIKSLLHLRNIGNSVIVIEHDEDTIRNADHIIDFGPGAGVKGGEIVSFGKLQNICKSKRSITGNYLSGRSYIAIPDKRREIGSNKIKLSGVKENNLQGINVEFPLNTFICVTGVSGAGKSSLINGVLVPAVAKIVNKSILHQGKFRKISGFQHINKLINIDQKPIGKSSRSNPATYTKVYDHIRDFFAKLPESLARGYKPGRFSFNVKGGRCEACQGAGTTLVEMHFLPDVYVECDICSGKRFNQNTLDVFYKGKNIADILDLTVLEALELFKNIPKINKILQTLVDVGMDYIHLGQPSTTLSGGEAQRIKLSRELCKTQTGQTLYVLDEPTTGLHFDDINKLLKVLNRLVDLKNTVIVVEHNLDVIKTADYIIDLGPEGGEKGGQLVASGTPENIAKIKASYTGKYLKNTLSNSV